MEDARERIVVTDCADVSRHVDREITLIGVLARTKIPTVCGVDVEGDDALVEKRVRVSGVLRRVESTEEIDPALPAAGRGPGLSWQLVDVRTGALARVAPESLDPT